MRGRRRTGTWVIRLFAGPKLEADGEAGFGDRAPGGELLLDPGSLAVLGVQAEELGPFRGADGAAGHFGFAGRDEGEEFSGPGGSLSGLAAIGVVLPLPSDGNGAFEKL